MDFCRCYKVDGRPVNTSVQADAMEFLNGLFDQFRDDFLAEIFGGSYANQFIGASDSCCHRRENNEAFRAISVEVKDKPTLYDALRSFTQGEVMSGVNCPTCHANVDTIKRCVIKTLGPTLMIHLKRFEMDFQTMTLLKLNSSLSFPMELNIEPFTKEGVARQEGVPVDPEAQDRTEDYYLYDLVGVVVHTGSLDSGHYYSYIKERVPIRGTEPKWFEFNDTSVTPWDPKRLEADCFGGESTSSPVRSAFGHSFGGGNYGKGAYILIYQRKGLGDKEDKPKKKDDSEEEVAEGDERVGRKSSSRSGKKKRTRSCDPTIEHREEVVSGNEGLRRSRSRPPSTPKKPSSKRKHDKTSATTTTTETETGHSRTPRDKKHAVNGNSSMVSPMGTTTSEDENTAKTTISESNPANSGTSGHNPVVPSTSAPVTSTTTTAQTPPPHPTTPAPTTRMGNDKKKRQAYTHGFGDFEDDDDEYEDDGFVPVIEVDKKHLIDLFDPSVLTDFAEKLTNPIQSSGTSTRKAPLLPRKVPVGKVPIPVELLHSNGR